MRFVFVSLLLLSPLAALSSTVNDRQIPYLEAQFKIDGSLDEPAWQQALQIELLYETRPGENITPPVRTLVYFQYCRFGYSPFCMPREIRLTAGRNTIAQI